MDYETLNNAQLLDLFWTTHDKLNDPTVQVNNRLLAAQLGELGAVLAARGINPDDE